jgi:hypothetical protein
VEVGVKFIDVPFGQMEWIDSIQFDKERTEAIIATLWVFCDKRTCSLRSG